jgi:PelA/Pel-15E family pectate lyase
MNGRFFRNGFGSGMLPVRIVLTAAAILWTNVAVGRPAEYLDRDAAWYRSDEAERVAANVLSWQSPLGGWPKNLDTAEDEYTGDPSELQPTFDNRATVDELRFLARMFAVTGRDEYKEAFVRGLDYILEAQYPNGGWPQRHPPGNSYAKSITFNDNAMVRLMELVLEVAESDIYSFLDAPRRTAAREAFDAGIACILKCQVEVDGRLTVWCAQHDERDFRPRKARAYELVSFSGSESAGIVELLMSLDEPSPDVIHAVEAAVEWFDAAKIEGIRIERRRDADAPRGFDKVVVEDPDAPPLWARFYDIETNRPIFCDRDGVPKNSLHEIGVERRTGYAWYGRWPRELLEEYPKWRARWGSQ